MHAATERLGVDVILDHDLTAPACSHGPTLLFERFTSGGSKRFFACSAYRDRKHCPFYMLEEDVRRGKKAPAPRETVPGAVNHSEENVTELREVKAQVASGGNSTNPAQYCHTCQCFVMGGKGVGKGHEGHKTTKLTKESLTRPTSLLSALDVNKTHAQFLFACSSVDYIVGELKRLGLINVLCIGTPRVHETLSNTPGFSSLLLDLDSRYARFFPETFCLFNMNNGHLFNETERSRLESFLPSCTAVVMDPPFGALPEVIGCTLRALYNRAVEKREVSIPEGLCPADELPTLFVFPYYLEDGLVRALPSMAILDYRVEYENHATYNSARTKKGSPVRIFTNIRPSAFGVPNADEYRYCDACDRYVASTNAHCKACNQCTTRDGPTYVHCNKCRRCVKPNRTHCETCNRCEQQPHTCESTANRGACHLCGSTEHKRKDCPKRDARQAAGGQSTAGVKRSHGGGARGGKSAHKNKVRRKET